MISAPPGGPAPPSTPRRTLLSWGRAGGSSGQTPCAPRARGCGKVPPLSAAGAGGIWGPAGGWGPKTWEILPERGPGGVCGAGSRRRPWGTRGSGGGERGLVAGVPRRRGDARGPRAERRGRGPGKRERPRWRPGVEGGAARQVPRASGLSWGGVIIQRAIGRGLSWGWGVISQRGLWSQVGGYKGIMWG